MMPLLLALAGTAFAAPEPSAAPSSTGTTPSAPSAAPSPGTTPSAPAATSTPSTPAPAAPVPPLVPVGGTPEVTVTLTEGGVVTGLVLAVSAQSYVLMVDGKLVQVDRARVAAVSGGSFTVDPKPLEDLAAATPDTATPGATPPDAAATGASATTPLVPENLGGDAPIETTATVPRAPWTPTPAWSTGRNLLVVGGAGMVVGGVARLAMGPPPDRFFGSPTHLFSVTAEYGGATSVLAGAQVQRRALRASGHRVSAVPLILGWTTYGIGTAVLAGGTLAGGFDSPLNGGSALVATSMGLGLVQAAVNGAAARR